MRMIIKMIACLFLLSNVAMASCESYEDVAEYKIGCAFDAQGFEQTYSKDNLMMYEKHLPNNLFDTVVIYVIDGNLEGIDFRVSRSLTNEERIRVLAAIHEKYGKTEYLTYGAYSKDIEDGILANVSFMPDAIENEGKASLLYVSKTFMKQLEDNDALTAG